MYINEKTGTKPDAPFFAWLQLNSRPFSYLRLAPCLEPCNLFEDSKNASVFTANAAMPQMINVLALNEIAPGCFEILQRRQSWVVGSDCFLTSSSICNPLVYATSHSHVKIVRFLRKRCCCCCTKMFHRPPPTNPPHDTTQTKDFTM